MPAPTPQTARDFADGAYEVTALCRCGREHRIDPETIVFMLGEDFPLATASAALSAELSCVACGSPRPAIAIRDKAATEEAAQEAATFIEERPSRWRVGERW